MQFWACEESMVADISGGTVGDLGWTLGDVGEGRITGYRVEETVSSVSHGEKKKRVQ